MKEVHFTLKKAAPAAITIVHGNYSRTFERGESKYWECTPREWELVVQPTGSFEKYRSKKEGPSNAS